MSANRKPSLDELVTMFEMLDTKRNGYISKQDIVKCLNVIINLR